MPVRTYGSKCAFRVPGVGGFTLVELLIVIAILALLIGLLLPALSGVRQMARSAKEGGAARQLMTAYQLYQNDFNGRIIPGYLDTPGVRNEAGDPISFPVNARYPWRLAPYLDYNLNGLYNDTHVLEAFENGLDDSTLQYVVSLYPSFGLNTVFLGGHQGSWGGWNNSFMEVFGRVWASAATEVKDPAKTITFTSARGPNDAGIGSQDDVLEGWYWVQPPRFTHVIWDDAAWDEDSDPADHGFVSLRHSNKAMIGFFDGHVGTLPEGELRDMRRWSPQADRPDWQLEPR